ncbi:hypothetical protein Tco_0272422 [Tanacetum coccineum]
MRKHFAAKKAEERRNRPPTKAQQRSIMCTYLKNMAGWNPKTLSTNETKEESSSKRTREELESDKSKKQKLDEKVEVEVDDAKEAEELKKCLEIVPDDGDDVTINATPLSVKIPIVEHIKTTNEGEEKLFQNNQSRWKDSVPLTKHTLHQMFNYVKLQVDYECEMEFELLRLGKIVRIKSLLEVTAVKELVTAVSAAGMKVTTVSVESYNC